MKLGQTTWELSPTARLTLSLVTFVKKSWDVCECRIVHPRRLASLDQDYCCRRYWLLIHGSAATRQSIVGSFKRQHFPTNGRKGETRRHCGDKRTTKSEISPSALFSSLLLLARTNTHLEILQTVSGGYENYRKASSSQSSWTIKK